MDMWMWRVVARMCVVVGESGHEYDHVVVTRMIYLLCTRACVGPRANIVVALTSVSV